MIIRLKNATFTANIGTLDSWSIRTSVIGGTLTQVPTITSIQKDSTTSTVLTYKYDATSYEVSTVTVTSNGGTVGSVDTNTSGEIKVTIPAGNTLNAAVQININLSVIGGDSGDTTYYTITYKYMSGSTSIKVQFTEQVAAGTTKTFSTSDAPAINGYTVSSVSPSGQQTINSDITVTYNYTVTSNSVPGADGVANEIFNLWNTDIEPTITKCTYVKETDRIVITTNESGITKWYNPALKYTIPVTNGANYQVQALIDQSLLDAEAAGTIKLCSYLVAGSSGNLIPTTQIGGYNGTDSKSFTADGDTITLTIYPLFSTDTNEDQLFNISSVIQNMIITSVSQ